MTKNKTIVEKVKTELKGVYSKVKVLEENATSLKLEISSPFEGTYVLELTKTAEPIILENFIDCNVEKITDKTFELQLDTGDKVYPVRMTYNHFKNWIFRVGTQEMRTKYLPTTDANPDPEKFFSEYLEKIRVVDNKKVMIGNECIVTL